MKASRRVLIWTDRGPGKNLDRNTITTFDSRAISCETIWQTAERKGLQNLIMAFPGSFPAPIARGYVVAPFLPYDDGSSLPLIPGCLYATQPAAKVRTESLILQRAQGWEGIDSPAALETEICLSNTHGKWEVTSKKDPGYCSADDKSGPALTFNVLIVNSSGKGYDQLIISKGKNDTRPLAKLCEGDWSPWCIEEIGMPDGTRSGSFRFKALRIDCAGQDIQILRSEVYPTSGFTHPENLSAELIRNVGPYIEHPALVADIVTFKAAVFEEMQYQVDWYIRVAQYMTQTYGWDMFYLRWNFPDAVFHQCLSQADPQAPAYDPERAATYLEIIREVLQLGDRLVEGLMRLADENTYAVVLSDHGNSSNLYQCDLVRRLEESGLMQTVAGRECAYLRTFSGDAIDWAQSKAYPLSGHQICVNLAGREPHGIVSAEDFEKIQERVLDALYDWKTSEGKRPVALALKRKDAQLIGYWGENCGDVIFIYAAGFSWVKRAGAETILQARAGANHGSQVPTAATDFSSNLAFMAFKGPDIRPGYQRDVEMGGYMRLVDLVPTLCYLMELDVPDTAQGCVLHDLLISATDHSGC